MSGLVEHPWQGKIVRTKGSAITMTKDDIQLLFEFDRWANNMVLQAASALNAEEFTRDLGGSFRSVRDTLVHIVGVERGWLTCWKQPSPQLHLRQRLLGTAQPPYLIRMRLLTSLRCSQSGRKSRVNKSSL